MSDWFEGESPGTSDSRTLRTGRGEAVAHSGSARDMRRAHDTESHMLTACVSLPCPHKRAACGVEPTTASLRTTRGYCIPTSKDPIKQTRPAGSGEVPAQ